MRRPHGLTDEAWECLKCDRRVERGMEAWDERVRQEIKIGGAKLVTGYKPDGTVTFRRCIDPCTFDKPSAWPKTFKKQKPAPVDPNAWPPPAV